MSLLSRLRRFAAKPWEDQRHAAVASLRALFRLNDSQKSMRAARRRAHRRGEEPWRREALHVLRPFGLGDVLLSTPALRAAKQANPNVQIFFYTDFPSLVNGLPYIDHVLPTSSAPQNAIFLGYEDRVPTSSHLAADIADVLGLAIAGADLVPDCIVRGDLVEGYRKEWGEGPNIVVSRRASRWTPNKDWPMERWNDLIMRLSRRYRVIEVGGAADMPSPVPGGAYIDLRDKTDVEELVAVVSAADLFLGPVSGPVHIAAAARVASVIIVGGYESTACTAYPGHAQLAETPRCSPCWLREPCPHDLLCLKSISVDDVEAEVERSLRSRHLAPAHGT